jgi:hypothetical protein
MIDLNIVAGFVQALGLFAGFAPRKADQIVEYTDRAAALLRVAGTTETAVAAAQEQLKAGSEQMRQWVAQGHEPTPDEFALVIDSIDETHARYQEEAAKLAKSPPGL